MDVTKLLEIIKDPDLKIKISNLVSENISLKEENFNLKKEISSLKDKSNIESQLTHIHNHYYLKSDTEKKEPYCTNCWDGEKKLIKLHFNFTDQGVQHFVCPKCKTSTKIGEYPRVMNQAEDINW